MSRRTSHPEATFGGVYGITRTATDDWFDPQLHADTDLFVDPFLMFDETTPPWSLIHGRLIDFFNEALLLLADAGGNRSSGAWTRAAAMFSFPEPAEFCLGYGDSTIFGAGSGDKLGRTMLDAGQRAIEAGLLHIDDFGELLLFGDGFGADRISDMVCNIVKDTFIDYTGSIATRHRLPTAKVKLQHTSYDTTFKRWRSGKVELPTNPCWTNAGPVGVLLVPERFLDELPKMDDGAFWDWVYSHQNHQLRQDLGFAITKGMKKKDIIALARRRATLRAKYGAAYAAAHRKRPPKPYDFATDPAFKVTPLRTGEKVAKLATLTLPTDPAAFCAFVRELVEHFRWAVEDRAIWKSFWAGVTARTEPQVQDLFHLSILHTCKIYNVDVTPEANAGPGPVDFKFSAGWSRRALVELKFAKSSSFWDNLEKQTPAYLKADDIECGYFVVVQHSDKHCDKTFTDKVTKTIDRVAKDSGRSYEAIFVDARKKPSASKLKRDP
jgi:hypothetical protein